MIIKKDAYFKRLVRCIAANKSLYIMILPVLAFYFIFHYMPMYGVIIAFMDFQPGRGILGGNWVGFAHFIDFFTGAHFTRVVSNTLIISFSTLIFGFPAPIILALLINEVRQRHFKRAVQTISYMPHFISLVVVAGMIRQFVSSRGVITSIYSAITGSRAVNLLQVPGYFVPIYVISDIWRTVGWGSIIFLAAITAIDSQLYEAAQIDGANRFRQMFHVTLPGILPAIVILLILRMGTIMSLGFEKIILLYNPAIFSTADVISTFVFRRGLIEFNWSFSAAVGLFNSFINFCLVIGANWISRRVNDTSLW